MPKNISSKQIQSIHKKLNNGDFLGCQENREWNPLCDTCCQHGSPIIQAEIKFYQHLIATNAIPPDISIQTLKNGNGIIKNCVNPDKTCRLGDNKTLFCKMYPLVSGESRSGGEIKIIKKNCQKCPGKNYRDPNFEKVVDAVFPLLRI